MPDELTLRATWGRDPLPAGGDGQLAYLLLDLTPDPQAPVTTSTTPLNLALVLDHSGSMSGPKLQHLKEAVQRVIDQLGPQDTLSIAVFDEHAKLLVPAQKVTDRAALQAAVAGLREAGGTQMSSGLQLGLDEVRQTAGPSVISRILLLTDGQTWGDADQCVALATEAGRLGVPISTFGVGADEDWSVSLLDRIAQASGGQADYIAQPSDMIGSFRKTVQTMQETVVQHTTLTLQLSAGVMARAVYRITPMIARVKPDMEADRAVTLPLGDIARAAPATVLFELTVPPRRPGQYRLARAVVRYEVPGAADPNRQVDQDILAGFVAGLPAGPGDPRVMNIVEKATAFRLQTRALEEAEVGNIPAATRNLRSAATRLLNLGEVELAQSAEQEAERLERKGQMSSAGTKKLTFATRKLALDDALAAAPNPPAPPAPAGNGEAAAVPAAVEDVPTQRVSVASVGDRDVPTQHVGAGGVNQDAVPPQGEAGALGAEIGAGDPANTGGSTSGE